MRPFVSSRHDDEARVFHRCAFEGILPALGAMCAAFLRCRGDGKTVIVNLSGRGDKDVDAVWQAL
jgi:tryptophan synthase beta subunit